MLFRGRNSWASWLARLHYLLCLDGWLHLLNYKGSNHSRSEDASKLSAFSPPLVSIQVWPLVDGVCTRCVLVGIKCFISKAIVVEDNE
jgi:hypothetical protein